MLREPHREVGNGMQAQQSPPSSPPGTGPGLSPPTLLRGSAAGDATASHFGFRRTLGQQPATMEANAASSSTRPSGASLSAAALSNAASLRTQFRSTSAGAAVPRSGPVAEGRLPRAAREGLHRTSAMSSPRGRVSGCSMRGVGVPEAVAEARSSISGGVSGGMSPAPAATLPPAATLVEMTSNRPLCSPSSCSLAANTVSTAGALSGVRDERVPSAVVATSLPSQVTGAHLVPHAATCLPFSVLST